MELKLIQVGGSTGVILPKDLLAKLNVEKGDMLTLNEEGFGEYRLTAHDGGFEAAMAALRKGKARYPNALRELAR